MQLGREPVDLKPIVALNIRRRLVEKRLNQTKFAKAMGCTQTTVSMWVNGRKTIDLDRLSQICGVLDCDAEYMLQKPV